MGCGISAVACFAIVSCRTELGTTPLMKTSMAAYAVRRFAFGSPLFSNFVRLTLLIRRYLSPLLLLLPPRTIIDICEECSNQQFRLLLKPQRPLFANMHLRLSVIH